MPARVVVLGGGVGGTLAANLLSRELGRDAGITVVDPTGMHLYQPGFLYVALGQADGRWLARDERTLLRDDVELAVETAERIDPEAGVVHLARGGALPYDHLVLAAGAITEDFGVPGVAEHAFGLLLTLTRGLHTAIRTPDYGLRESIRVDQRELYDLTMGIVGFGGVGREVAKRAVGFGMRVLGVDIEDVAPEPGVEAIWKPERMHEMLGQADVVVIGLPLTKATRHLFTRDLFRRMKPSAILINVTRGEIVYGDDLRHYLLREFATLLGIDRETVGEPRANLDAIPFWGEVATRWPQTTE